MGPAVVAGMLPIGPGGPQSGFSTPRYISRGFRKKKSGPRTPRPPGGPPALGSLVWSAEGLPSTRNWPFRWPLSPTSPPQVIPKAMWAVSWPGRWFWGVELHQRRQHSLAAGAPALLQFEWLSNTRGAQALRARPGWLSYAPCSRGGQEEESRCFFARLF
jgi:hypothetical protein